MKDHCLYISPKKLRPMKSLSILDEIPPCLTKVAIFRRYLSGRAELNPYRNAPAISSLFAIAIEAGEHQNITTLNIAPVIGDHKVWLLLFTDYHRTCYS